MPHPLISAPELAGLLREGEPVVLDVRWRLDAPDGREAYRAGHIPTAQYVRLDNDLARHGEPTDGRHPLPSPDAFAETVRRWGIDDGDEVIVYDDWQSFGAARAWWMLTDAGIPARVLDGGLSAWRAIGGELEGGDPAPPVPGTAAVQPGRLRQLTMADAAAHAERGLLLDARAGERFRGETEPLDPRAGHIPGALNAPTTENSAPDGRLRSENELRERFGALGAREDSPVGVYCGSGVSAAHSALALTVAGLTPALYVGSWSQWSNHPDRPIATGA